MTTRPTVLAAALWIAASLGVSPARGTEVKIFQTQSQAGFLAGTLEGVSVDSLGRMELAPKAERVTSLSEPFLLSAAVHPDGWVVGTGNAGKVLRIDRKGQVTELFTTSEPEVFAVWADPDGTVFAGTSPQGKVYRIPKGGKGEVFFEPGETYIWKLARGADGSLLVGTGTQGKLFKVDAKGKGELLYDSDDTHVRALEVLPGGDILMGTAGEGLILRLGKDGQARTLYDADEPEVVALSAAPDGTCYAAVTASESSLVDLSKPPAGGPGAQAKPGEPSVSVTVEGEAPQAAAVTGTRREGATGPRSQILSISPVGVVESLWSFNDETVYGLLFRKDRLWVATGLDGKLYSYADAQMLLEKDVDERQIVTLLPGDPGPAFATTNAAAFYRITEGTEKTGTYTSAALDAQQVARFGSFRWRGDAPPGGAVRFSFRSGVSAEPDRTWSLWTEPREGQEIPLDALPRGRYIQWRAELSAGGSSSPRLYGTELSYRQENLSPKIGGLLPLDPGQILVPANFNPTNQVYEPAHPNREGIFTSLTPSGEDDGGGGRTKPLWKIGYQTLRWSAADPNGDRLTYDLSFRPVGKDGSTKGEWLTVASDLTQDYYSFDATALPDGVYRFRLTASDKSANEPGSELKAEQVSDPVVIDHAPPALAKTEVEKAAGGTNGHGRTLRVTVRDEASPLREAVYSVNAAEWKPVVPADGLIDGRTETLLIEAGEPGSLVLLRVTDAAHNVITFDLTQNR
ncbi:MAG TPA: WD40 repeat domain-containing protein [Thermoanaerobaculia bacterium]|nr:WD40 repeat domain-containing protein [Thermoanaerobaculia bacterium]